MRISDWSSDVCSSDLNPKATLNMAMHGQGIELTNQDGKNYIDASGGAADCCLGHGHPAVIEAIKGQLDKIAYVHSSFMTTPAKEDQADLLERQEPGDRRSGVKGKRVSITVTLGVDRQNTKKKDT